MEFQIFHITVKGLIFYHKQFLLMASNDPDFLGAYECPGGRINRGELLEVSLKRELIEEIGLDLDVVSHTLELFALNQRDEVEYDWDNKIQIIEVYYKITIPNTVELHVGPKEESDRLIWVNKDTDLDKATYRIQSRKIVYQNAQRTL